MSKYVEAINGTVLYDRSYVLNRSLVVDCQLHTDKAIDTGHNGGGLIKVHIPPGLFDKGYNIIGYITYKNADSSYLNGLITCNGENNEIIFTNQNRIYTNTDIYCSITFTPSVRYERPNYTGYLGEIPYVVAAINDMPEPEIPAAYITKQATLSADAGAIYFGTGSMKVHPDFYTELLHKTGTINLTYIADNEIKTVKLSNCTLESVDDMTGFTFSLPDSPFTGTAIYYVHGDFNYKTGPTTAMVMSFDYIPCATITE